MLLKLGVLIIVLKWTSSILNIVLIVAVAFFGSLLSPPPGARRNGVCLGNRGILAEVSWIESEPPFSAQSRTSRHLLGKSLSSRDLTWLAEVFF